MDARAVGLCQPLILVLLLSIHLQIVSPGHSQITYNYNCGKTTGYQSLLSRRRKGRPTRMHYSLTYPTLVAIMGPDFVKPN